MGLQNSGFKLMWSKVSNYCIQHGDYTVCKIVVRSREHFEAWLGNERLGAFTQSKDAKAFVLAHERRHTPIPDCPQRDQF